jgi:hypothetical protein
MIEQELGQPIDVVFSEFSDKPIAAASLAPDGCKSMLYSTLFIAAVGGSNPAVWHAPFDGKQST